MWNDNNTANCTKIPSYKVLALKNSQRKIKMISRPEWWTYRKFGWGLAPKTWQAWVYIGIFVAITFSIQGLASKNIIPYELSTGLTIGLILLVIIDSLHTMFQLPRVHDERENHHQLLIERNVSYAAIAGITAIMIYETIVYSINIMNGIIPVGINLYIPFDWKLGVLLLGMVLTKGISSYYVEKKM